jgi:hypothetical protein
MKTFSPQAQNLSLWILAFITSGITSAQYTETINTNKPGFSQGAFAVGKNVIQVEGSFFHLQENHNLLQFERTHLGTDFQLRYGLLTERLEINYTGAYNRVEQSNFSGGGSSDINYANLSRSTLGLKYLVFDPTIFFGDKEVNLLSYHANNKLDWLDLIPAVSVFAGANVHLGDNNPLVPALDPRFSPRFELITQHNLGRWVVVTNIIADRIATEFPSYQWFLTVTHSINNKWAVFGEYQGLNSNFYSDDLARGGVAYLVTNDWQVDASATGNFKDTPRVLQVNVGMSYRFDFHKDEEIKQKGARASQKKDNKKKKIDLENEG